MRSSLSVLLGVAFIVSLSQAAKAQGEAPPAGEAPGPAAAPPPAPPGAAAPPPAAAPAPAAAPPGAMPPPAAAEGEPPGAHTHDGFYLRLGLDGGPVFVTEQISLGGTQAGSDIKWSGFTPGYDLMIGGSPIPGLAIGGALLVTTTSSPKVKQGNFEATADGVMVWSAVGVFGDYYFDPHAGGHLFGILGFSSISFVKNNCGGGQACSTSNSPSGPLFGIGGGYDFWIGNQWSVGPVARIFVREHEVRVGRREGFRQLLLSEHRRRVHAALRLGTFARR